MSKKRQLTPDERYEWRKKAIADAEKAGYRACTEDPVSGAIGFIRTGPDNREPYEEEPSGMGAFFLIVAIIAAIFMLVLK